MAIQTFTCVTKSDFDAHSHNFSRVSRIGVDGAQNFSSPQIADVGIGQYIVSENQRLRAVGIETVVWPTSAPV